MTIVFIYHSFLEYGGLERAWTYKMNRLVDDYGFKVILITYEQVNRPLGYKLSPKIHYEDWSIPLYKEYHLGTFRRIIYYRYMRRLFLLKLSNLIDKEKVDILVGTTYDYVVLDVLHQLRKKVKTIIETHTAKRYLYLMNVPFNFHSLRSLLKNFVKHRTINFVRTASAFVPLTLSDSKDWKSFHNTIVIPNILHDYPAEISSRGKENKCVISVGRMDDDQKGYDLLLKAWTLVADKHFDWKLAIYGRGELKDELLKLRSELSLTSTVQIFNPTNDIYVKYMESDFYVMSSRYEGFGIALIEAMACGIPCVAFDCPCGPSDVIENGVNGFLIENGNIEKLANMIIYLVEHEEERLAMGRKARDDVRRYMPEVVMPMWLRLYESLDRKIN